VPIVPFACSLCPWGEARPRCQAPNLLRKLLHPSHPRGCHGSAMIHPVAAAASVMLELLHVKEDDSEHVLAAGHH
jgi:hypothetical protein